jgi:excisionase family DNA binding protein
MGSAVDAETSERPTRDVFRELNELVAAECRRLGAPATLDLMFAAFLRRMSRFGYFTFGPINIDVRMIEDIVERTIPRDPSQQGVLADDTVRFSRLVMDELRRSGGKVIDELHLLLAFMRTNEGLPGRVFAELGVSPAQIEAYARSGDRLPEAERLYSPDEAAEYLGVHVQTVRSWIRSGRLPARRLAGQRALRIRAFDLESVLEPVEPGEEP